MDKRRKVKNGIDTSLHYSSHFDINISAISIISIISIIMLFRIITFNILHR